MMPSLSTWVFRTSTDLSLIARCRAQGVAAPVLILSARRSVDSEYADWSRVEETAPVYKAIRHCSTAGKTQKSSAPIFCSPHSEPVRLQTADLELDLVRHEARRGSQVDSRHRSSRSWNTFAAMLAAW